MIKSLFCVALLISLACFFSCKHDNVSETQWHHPLANANNDYWRQRIPVSILNNTTREIAGDVVEVQLGTAEGQAPITGMDAEGIRVTTVKGDQLLYRISDSEGKLIEKGPIPENSRITIPVECKANEETTNFIYFANPSAWPLGDYLKADQKINDSLEVKVETMEEISIKERGKTDDQDQWKIRASVRTINYSDDKSAGVPVCAEIVGVMNRLHDVVNRDGSVIVTNGAKSIPFFRTKDYIIFDQDIPGKTEQTNYIYFGKETPEEVGSKEVKDLSSITTNLVNNNDFEDQDIPEWRKLSDRGNVIISPESQNGSASLQVMISDSGSKESGLSQNLKVKPGRTYLFSSWVRCSDKVGESDFNRTIRQRAISARFIDKNGKDTDRIRKSALNPDVHQDNAWTQLLMIIRAPESADSVILSLVNSTVGTVWFDNVQFMEVLMGATNPMSIELNAAKDLKDLTVWQGDPLVKVFRDDLPPVNTGEVSISSARNEYEALQLVIRSPREYKQLHVKVSNPVNSSGNQLDKPEIGIIGYVPVDYPSNYIVDRVSPAWRHKIFSGSYGSDGWIGLWPDPILPYDVFDLAKDQTQPVWLEFKIAANAVPGDYTGNVQLLSETQVVVKEIPYRVHVWDFQLGDRSHMSAIFDVRTRSDSGKRVIWKTLAGHRVTPDRIIPEPKWIIENDRIIFDFTEHDIAAGYFFDSLNNITAYAPNYFYLFGWANPPSPHFGQKPYDGESPYPGVDRRQIRPEFKKAYQSALRTYWNHMKQKGWADKVLLYVSDEPHDRPEINAQMQALCDMIHEVDPEIPIYVSCWEYRKDFIGYIDVWGMSNHAGPLDDLLKIRKTGNRIIFTTDGKMCIDTPYFGYERMLPYFCFKYGAEAYEFWAADWYTYNPYEYGWHRFNRESQVPGSYNWVRYPNGDGYIVYPGNLIGHEDPVPSLRIKLLREGVEDYEYLHYLDSLVTAARKSGIDVTGAMKALESATSLVTIPSEEGRYSSRNLADPYAVLKAREQMAIEIERLLK